VECPNIAPILIVDRVRYHVRVTRENNKVLLRLNARKGFGCFVSGFGCFVSVLCTMCHAAVSVDGAVVSVPFSLLRPAEPYVPFLGAFVKQKRKAANWPRHVCYSVCLHGTGTIHTGLIIMKLRI
jgi:hypothetical protein